jgi:hypothetical protein
MIVQRGQAWRGADLDAWFDQSAPLDARGPRAYAATAGGRSTIALEAYADDVAPRTPNSNPRAQLVSPFMIEPIQSWRAEVGLLIPAGSLPATVDKAAGRWVEFAQFAYGAPYAGSPPLRLLTMDGQTFGLRLGDGAWGWSAPLLRDVQYDFILDWTHATKATYGRYRLRVGHGGATPGEVKPITAYDCVNASNGGGPNALYLNAYMAAGTADHIGPFHFSNVRLTRTT